MLAILVIVWFGLTVINTAIKPNPKRHRNYDLPHVTIQMPVYKEGLKG